MITYPNNPEAYVSTPWLDETTGISWLWAVRGPDINNVPQGKWGRAPTIGIVESYTESATPPADTTLPWFDTVDQSWNVFDEAEQVWVMTSGTAGVDGTNGTNGINGSVLPPAIRPITGVGASAHSLVTADVSAYLRFTGTSAKTLTVPVTGPSLAVNAGDIITIRNVGVGDITIIPENLSPTILNYIVGANVIAPNTTAQMIYVGTDTWDIL